MSDLYERVTQTIIEQLERGCAPWVQPWATIEDPLPRNALSKRPYRGINRLLLGMTQAACGYRSNQWVTFRQALELGGSVRKGEQATLVVYFEIKTSKEEAEDERRYPLLRQFHVFNVSQCDGLPPVLTQVADPPSFEWSQEEAAEEVIEASKAEIVTGGFRAYYSAGSDRIHIPARSVFRSAADYYATSLHELAHWTGHPSRLARQFGKRFGDAAYAMEELVAELASAYLCAHCRIDGQLQHASYLASWLELLHRDKRALFTAAAQAQKAADLLLAPTRLAWPAQEYAEAA